MTYKELIDYCAKVCGFKDGARFTGLSEITEHFIGTDPGQFRTAIVTPLMVKAMARYIDREEHAEKD